MASLAEALREVQKTLGVSKDELVNAALAIPDDDGGGGDGHTALDIPDDVGGGDGGGGGGGGGDGAVDGADGGLTRDDLPVGTIVCLDRFDEYPNSNIPVLHRSMGYHDPDNLRKWRVISLPIYGIVCQHDASNLQVKVRTYKPNDALNITDYSGTGWWIEVRFLRSLTDAEARDQPWQTYAEAEKARAARLEHARAEATPIEGRPAVGTPCRLAPGRGVLLSQKRIAKHNPDPAHIAASDAAEEMLLSVCPEPGTPNDFGIFNRHQGNPTAAYIDGASTVEGYFRNSRKGYCTMKLKGQHWTEIRWDRDTMAPPPDDLRAVHVSAPDGQHGWLFVPELVEAPAEKKPKSATKKGGAKS